VFPWVGGKVYIGAETYAAWKKDEKEKERAERERQKADRKRQRKEQEKREREQREFRERAERERQARIAEEKIAEAARIKKRLDHLTSLAIAQVRDPNSDAAIDIANMPLKECGEGGIGSVWFALSAYGVEFIEEVEGETETFSSRECDGFVVADAAIEAGLLVYTENFAGTGRDGYHGRN